MDRSVEGSASRDRSVGGSVGRWVGRSRGRWIGRSRDRWVGGSVGHPNRRRTPCFGIGGATRAQNFECGKLRRTPSCLHACTLCTKVGRTNRAVLWRPAHTPVVDTIDVFWKTKHAYHASRKITFPSFKPNFDVKKYTKSLKRLGTCCQKLLF